MNVLGIRFARLRLLVVAIAAGLLLVAATGANSQPPTSISIDAGLTPRLDATQVIALAKSDLARMASGVGKDTASTILSVHAMKAGSIGAAEPGAPGFEGSRANEIIWVVRGTGTFVGQFGRGKDHSSTTGYLLIDDTGDVIGMGMP